MIASDGGADGGHDDVAGFPLAPGGDAEPGGPKGEAEAAQGDGSWAWHSHGGPGRKASPEASPERQAAPALRPPWPLAKRLNRNALTVVAALAGVTVLTVLVVTSPSRRTPGSAGGPAGAADRGPPSPARPAFLDQPPRAPAPTAGHDAAHAGAASMPVHGGRDGGRRPRAGIGGEIGAGLPVPPPIDGEMPGAVSVDGGRGQDGTGGVPPGSSAAGPGPGAPSAREQAYQAALTSSVLVSESGRTATASGVGPASGVPGSEPPAAAAGAVSYGVPPVPAMAPSAPAAPAAPTQYGPPGLREPVAPATVSSPMPTGPQPAAVRLEPIGSAYVVRGGTLIPGLLLTGVNSDLPGEVLGQTSRDVFDSRTERVLLIPKGSRLVGSYDNRAVGTGRLIVGWNRLILPDGRSLDLPRLAATDERGQAGLHDQVDHHYARIYGAALLTSLITAGVQLSQPQQSALYAAPSSRQVAAGALGQGLGDVAIESARRGLDVPPTVVVRPGQPFNVFLSGDVAFDEPYVAAAARQDPGGVGSPAPGGAR